MVCRSVLTAKISNLNKKEQIRRTFEITLGKITKSKIKELCPGISEATIENALRELQKEGYIIRHGAGKGTFYTKI